MPRVFAVLVAFYFYKIANRNINYINFRIILTEFVMHKIVLSLGATEERNSADQANDLTEIGKLRELLRFHRTSNPNNCNKYSL